jgi:hypothetical protein
MMAQIQERTGGHRRNHGRCGDLEKGKHKDLDQEMNPYLRARRLQSTADRKASVTSNQSSRDGAFEGMSLLGGAARLQRQVGHG